MTVEELVAALNRLHACSVVVEKTEVRFLDHWDERTRTFERVRIIWLSVNDNELSYKQAMKQKGARPYVYLE